MDGVRAVELTTWDDQPLTPNLDARLSYRGEQLHMVGQVLGPTTLSREDYVTVVRVEATEQASSVSCSAGILCTGCGARVVPGTPGTELTGDTPMERHAWCARCVQWRADNPQ